MQPLDALWNGRCQIVKDLAIEVFEWKRRWQMERDFGFHLTNASGDLQDAILQHIILGVRPRCAAQSNFSQGLQQDIGGAVEKEPEVIGFKRVKRGAIRMEKGLVILDEAFHPAWPADRPRPQ